MISKWILTLLLRSLMNLSKWATDLSFTAHWRFPQPTTQPMIYSSVRSIMGRWWDKTISLLSANDLPNKFNKGCKETRAKRKDIKIRMKKMTRTQKMNKSHKWRWKTTMIRMTRMMRTIVRKTNTCRNNRSVCTETSWETTIWTS